MNATALSHPFVPSSPPSRETPLQSLWAPLWPKGRPAQNEYGRSPPAQNNVGPGCLVDVRQNELDFIPTKPLGGKLYSGRKVLVSDTEQSFTKVSLDGLAKTQAWFLPPCTVAPRQGPQGPEGHEPVPKISKSPMKLACFLKIKQSSAGQIPSFWALG